MVPVICMTPVQNWKNIKITERLSEQKLFSAFTHHHASDLRMVLVINTILVIGISSGNFCKKKGAFAGAPGIPSVSQRIIFVPSPRQTAWRVLRKDKINLQFARIPRRPDEGDLCFAPTSDGECTRYRGSSIRSAVSTILSGVKPNFSKTVPPGAEAPNLSMPMTLPPGPT